MPPPHESSGSPPWIQDVELSLNKLSAEVCTLPKRGALCLCPSHGKSKALSGSRPRDRSQGLGRLHPFVLCAAPCFNVRWASENKDAERERERERESEREKREERREKREEREHTFSLYHKAKRDTSSKAGGGQVCSAGGHDTVVRTEPSRGQDVGVSFRVLVFREVLGTRR